MKEKEAMIHDRECQTCKKLFACVGKLEDVRRCVNYQNRGTNIK